MSDRESNHDLQENGDNDGRSPARERSRSRSVSRRRSRSRSGHRSSHRKSSHRSHKRRSHSRSYSRSPRRHRRRHSRSRSRSRSHSHDRHRSSHRYSRSRSRSPRGGGGGYGRRGLMGPRDCPPPSSCVGVFGMNINSTESTLAHYFSEFGKIEKIQIVYDAKTGRSRGFGFIYFENVEDAIAAKDKAAGMDIDGHRIRVDFSVTQRPHTPTPGIYMGKPMYRGRRDEYYPSRYGYNRSPSPYRRRSRSYSYSPRRD